MTFDKSMPDGANTLHQLCALCGIQTEFFDIWGNRRAVSRETLLDLVAAMGMRADSEQALGRELADWQARQWLSPLAPVQVAPEADQPMRIRLTLKKTPAEAEFEWRLVRETGEESRGRLDASTLPAQEQKELPSGVYARYRFSLPDRLAAGYHRFEIAAAGRSADMLLIVTPATCYQPPALHSGGRIWGPAAQLYAVRSRRNWGMGDFTDLGELAGYFGKQGAGVVGLNPLHELFPHNPEHASPYSPSSRLWLNTAYIDPEAVPELKECKTAQKTLSSRSFRQRLAKLRKKESVDYAGVGSAKQAVLEQLYLFFRENHLETETEYGRQFRAFQAEMGPALQSAAAYQALQEFFFAKDPSVWGWPAWPPEYRDPESPSVAAFLREHPQRVEYFQYLQWHAERQLAAAAAAARRAGAELYRDLAISSDLGGSEVWSNQALYGVEATVGAPPDDFNLAGQNWGLPPLIPHRLVQARYQPFIAMLRRNMRGTGALRIDHVMGLMRLFWIPKGCKPAQGAYVHYPFSELIGILALESRRNRCLVVGEDLGTVPDQVRAALPAADLLSYKVLFFEKDGAGEFKPPGAYPARALVAVSTHDLPTLNGWWEGLDIEERAELGLFPSRQELDRQRRERARDRASLLRALERESLAPRGISDGCALMFELPAELPLALHRYAARTPCRIMVFQLEDMLGERRQVNLPGTVTERPNWRRRLSIALEDLPGDPRAGELCAALRRERGSAQKTAAREDR